MGITVQKYGGKLVKNKECMQKVADSIVSSYKKGEKVVVVVSAIGDTTDELTNKINVITTNPNKREVDVVLSSGEQIAMGLLCIMLNEMGYKSISLSGWQAGIITDNNYTDANILDIKTENIINYLDDGYIVVVAGFQGIDSNDNITTLGRGGSDTTATELAIRLNAEKCEIYKDTKCICTADPKIIPTARKIDIIQYDNMLELSKMGAKVLAYKSLEYAKQNNLNLIVKSVENDSIGTKITNQKLVSSSKIISCTKKKYDENNDIITFIINGDCNEILNEINKIIALNNIDEYKIQNSEKKISIIVKNIYAIDLLKNIHDYFILQ